MDERGVALGDLTPEVAVDLVRQAPWRCDRKQYAVFVVKRFVEYLAAQGMAKPPAPLTPAQVARAALRRDYEGYRRLVLGALGEAGKQLRPTAPTKCQIGERHVGRWASPSAQVIGKASRADAGARWKEFLSARYAATSPASLSFPKCELVV